MTSGVRTVSLHPMGACTYQISIYPLSSYPHSKA